MAFRRGRGASLGGLTLIALCAFVVFSLLDVRLANSQSRLTFVSAPPQNKVERRQIASLLLSGVPAALALPGPVLAEEEDRPKEQSALTQAFKRAKDYQKTESDAADRTERQYQETKRQDELVGEDGFLTSSRLAVYMGKANQLREASKWFRFTVGDLVEKGADTDIAQDCDTGLCPSGLALNSIVTLLSPATTGSRGKGVSLAPIEYALLTPMNTISDMSALDPDASDTAKEQAGAFQLSAKVLGKRAKAFDYKGTKEAYVECLKNLNYFIRTANEGVNAKPEDERFLPYIPLSVDDVQNDEWWKVEREKFEEASNPQTQFVDRNALVPKNIRQGLKRFPGATIITR